MAKTKNPKFAIPLIFAFLLSIFFISAAVASEKKSDRDNELAAILAAQKLTGAVWATVTPDSGVTLGVAGIKNANTGENLSSNDRIHVGSITKTLVATGVLHLISQGRLKLETPVSDLLPGVVIDNPWVASDPVLVRHLLDHTAGLDDARLWQVFSLRPGADTPLANAFKGNDSLLRLRTRPGSRFSYSNMGYTMLGMVIESITGEPYEKYLDRELLKPLAMHDSSFGYISQQNDKRIAMGHFESGEAHFVAPMYLRPAGQFTTTAADMALFAKFLMGDGRIGNEIYIDQALLLAMGKPTGTEAANAGLPVGYGLGLFKRDRNGAVGLCHGGDTSGYHAMLCIYPERQSAFFVSINTGSEVADYNAIDRALLSTLKLRQVTSASRKVMPAMDTRSWEGFYVPAPNRISTFAYIDTLLNFATLDRDGNILRFKPFQSKEVLLNPAGGAFFSAPERLLPSHVFLVSREGKRIISNGSQSFEQASVPKLVLLWVSLVSGCAGLLYILLSGFFRLVTWQLNLSHPVLVPLLSALALALPLPFFYWQSFMEIGELTLASGLLAVVTALLPFALTFGLWRALRKQTKRRSKKRMAFLDSLAMVSVLQWTLVLAAWGLLPLRLWV